MDRISEFNELTEPQKRGQATEAIIKSAFVVKDIPILVPEYDNEPYDIVIEVDEDFHKIQCKTAYGDDATVQFETVSTRTTASGHTRTDYTDEVDFFAVYNPIKDEIYLIPVTEAASGKMKIRTEAAENNQTVGVNWHEDYLLNAQVQQMRA